MTKWERLIFGGIHCFFGKHDKKYWSKEKCEREFVISGIWTPWVCRRCGEKSQEFKKLMWSKEQIKEMFNRKKKQVKKIKKKNMTSKLIVPKPFKVYILIKDWVDVGHAINTAAHATLIAHKAWENDKDYQDWFNNSFRKVTCKVNAQEFGDAKLFKDFCIVTEMAFNNEEVALIFKPRIKWNKFFHKLTLYS